ncbi:unnamed protein product [Aphis gossypii]|uniref:Uncharacterized protein n=1 Tax=Aphis gossypii TaxID=80765 RepID=A0A9P0IL90_APHGO|nr:unnamed protein product [Aphis gossypii]
MNNETKIIFAYRCPRKCLTEINNDISYVHTSHLIHEKNACVRLTARLNLNYSVHQRASVRIRRSRMHCERDLSYILYIVMCVYRILLCLRGAHTASLSGVKDTIKHYSCEGMYILFTIDRDRFQFPFHHTHRSPSSQSNETRCLTLTSHICVYTVVKRDKFLIVRANHVRLK